MRPQLALSPSVELLVADGRHAVLLDDQSCVALTGQDVGWFSQTLMPLLDGSRTAEKVAGAAGALRADVLALLGELTARGLVVESQPHEATRPHRGPGAVVIAGRQPWRTALARELEGEPGAAVQLVADARAASDHRCDLLVGAMSRTDLAELMLLARQAHDRRCRSITAWVEGSQLVLGPLVVPGRTACWNCARLRRLAHASDPAAACSVQSQLLARHGSATLGPETPIDRLLAQLLALQLAGDVDSSPLAGRIMIFDTATLRSQTHDVVPLPWCRVCGGAGALEDGAPRRAGWVDPLTGAFAGVSITVPDAGLPVIATVALADYQDDDESPGNGVRRCSGKGVSCDEAIAGALGEAFERYSATRHRIRSLERCALDQLDGEALDPRSLCLYDDTQYDRPGFPYARFNAQQPIHWTAGRWLDTGGPVRVPALPVYLWLDVPESERFCQVTSSGLAAATTLLEASRRALFELIERDALMITWLARRAPRRLAGHTARDATSRRLVRGLEARSAEVELYVLESEFDIPTVLCLALGDGARWPGATVTTAAHPSLRSAVRSALLEQGQVGPAVHNMLASGRAKVPAEPEEVRDLGGHALYYGPVERQPAFDFLRNSASTCDLDDFGDVPDTDLEHCIDVLRVSGIRVATVDVTPPDVAATTPFRVVRAIATSLQPLHFGFGRERRAGPRLAAALTGPINGDPHPLA